MSEYRCRVESVFPDNVWRGEVGREMEICPRCICEGDIVELVDDMCPLDGGPVRRGGGVQATVTGMDRETGTVTLQYEADIEAGPMFTATIKGIE